MPPPFGSAVVNGITFAWASPDTEALLADTMAATALMPSGVLANIAANGFIFNLSSGLVPELWPYSGTQANPIVSLFGLNSGVVAWSRHAVPLSIPNATKKNTSLVLHETGHTVDSLGAAGWTGPTQDGISVYGGSWDTTYFTRADYDPGFGGPEQFALPAGSFLPLRRHPAVINGFQTLRAASLTGTVPQSYASRVNEGEYVAELFAFYCWNNLTAGEAPVSADGTIYPGTTARGTIDNYFYAVLTPSQRQELASAFASHLGVGLLSGLYPTWPLTDAASLISLVDSGASATFFTPTTISGPSTTTSGTPTVYSISTGDPAYSVAWTVDGVQVSTALPAASVAMSAGSRTLAVSGRTTRGGLIQQSRTITVS